MSRYSGFEVPKSLTDIAFVTKAIKFGPEKFLAVLKLPYIEKTSRVFEVKVRDLAK